MSEANEELRAELVALVEETRRHLLWMQDAGVRNVRRIGEAPAAVAATAPRSPVPTDRARPAFMGDPAPTRAPAPPPARPAPPPPVTRPPVAPPAPVAPPRLSIVPPAAPPAAPASAADPARALQVIREDLGDCRRCKLAPERQKIVFGQGNPRAELLFIGEGPGEDEDQQGLAFVGRAGQLLTKMIEAMGYARDEVYICNIVKCRPPGNRRPEPDEIERCRPFAERQILAIRPKVIVALGATATQSLLRTDVGITRLRNQWTAWQGIPVMPTFHPSYLLRAPEEKAKAWDDLKLVVARLGRQLPGRR